MIEEKEEEEEKKKIRLCSIKDFRTFFHKLEEREKYKKRWVAD